MATLSGQELAALVPCSVEYVDRLHGLGLLEPSEAEGLFPSSDVHVVRLMAAVEAAGISLDDVARGVATGELSFPLERLMPEPARLSETFEELAARLERSPEFLRRLSVELGLPPPADDRMRQEDAEILALMATKVELADDEDLSRLARLYAGGAHRIVTSGVQFFDAVVRQRVATYEISNAEKDRLIFGYAAEMTELVSELLPWLQRRHREHLFVEYIVGLIEGFMDERGISPRQPRRPPAIAFLDLAGYTALAEERGDEAAAEVAAGLARIVGETARVHGGEPVKWLGDGVMFHFADPGRAILSGLELVEQAERSLSVPARIGINAGWVIAQEGDYFGRTVKHRGADRRLRPAAGSPRERGSKAMFHRRSRLVRADRRRSSQRPVEARSAPPRDTRGKLSSGLISHSFEVSLSGATERSWWRRRSRVRAGNGSDTGAARKPLTAPVSGVVSPMSRRRGGRELAELGQNHSVEALRRKGASAADDEASRRGRSVEARFQQR